MRLSAAGRSETGPFRTRNEDAFLVRRESGLCIVADGSGSPEGPESAATVAVRSVEEYLRLAGWPAPGVHGVTVGDGRAFEADLLAAAIRFAGHRIFLRKMTDRTWMGSGATLAATLFTAEAVRIAHVGDCRVYRWRAGHLEALTRDHSLLNEVPDAAAQVREARDAAHLVTRAVGIPAADRPELRTESVGPGDTYLLCSDGLSSALPDDRIREALAGGGTPEKLCDELVARAMAVARAHDNITVAVARIEG